MTAKELLKKALEEQNEFILKIFNDDRISDEVKLEYMEEYNKLNIKVQQ